MRKLIFAGLFLSLLGCSTDDPLVDEFYFEILPIIEVIDMPTSVNFNDVYTVHYTYTLPTTCHSYEDLYYLTSGTERTVAVVSRVINEVNGAICEDIIDPQPIQGSFNFHVLNNNGTYIFKFWQGTDENGQDEYLVYEVPIN